MNGENMKHKHAEFIKAWADDQSTEFEYRYPHSQSWGSVTGTPVWDEKAEYRIKPESAEKVYPETLMGDGELCRARYNGGFITHTEELMGFKRIANAAIRHAIDARQVVRAEDCDAAVDALHALRRTPERNMAIAKAVSAATYNASHSGSRKAFCDLDLDLNAIIASVK